MTYRTPESLIRQIMSSGSITESTASDHMNPALRTDEAARLTAAAEVLKASGVTSATIKDNTISVTAGEVELASNVLNAALRHGMISVAPQLSSAEAIAMPEPHVPAPEFAKEEAEELDEISKKTLGNYVQKAAASHANAQKELGRGEEHFEAQARDPDADEHEEHIAPHEKTSAKRVKGIARAAKKLAKEEVELNELSYSKLKGYEKQGTAQVADAAKKNKLDARIAKRAAYVAKAKNKSTTKLKKAAFGEEVSPVAKIVAICEGLRLRETLHSECGKHTAKIYKDTDWGEHTVKFHINGKHHEPADYHTSDHDDAHHTAKAELHRMTKLNGALKEATEEEVNELLEDFDQLDELSKGLLGRYVDKATTDIHNKGFKSGEHWAKRNVAASGDSAIKSIKRQTNVNKAVKKIAKEEVAKEGDTPFPLNEISKDLATSYAKKAMRHEVILRDDRKRAGGNKTPEWKDLTRKIRNRSQGVDRALTKEEVEQLDEMPQIGTYSNNSGQTLSIHRHPNDPKHLFVAHNGKVKDYHYGKPEELHKKLTRDGFTGNIREDIHQDDVEKRKEALRRKKQNAKWDKDGFKHLQKEEVEQVDEVSKGTLKSYISKASRSKGNHEKLGLASIMRSKEFGDKHTVQADKHFRKEANRGNGIDTAKKKLREDIDLTEAKADKEKAKKLLFKHPEANAIGKTMMGATKHFNYVQDAVDHVYNNHSKDLSYEDFDAIRPHLEDHFKKSGLK